jgi:hypothetical protein
VIFAGGYRRVRAEHLLAALCHAGGTAQDALAAHGLTADAVQAFYAGEPLRLDPSEDDADLQAILDDPSLDWNAMPGRGRRTERVENVLRVARERLPGEPDLERRLDRHVLRAGGCRREFGRRRRFDLYELPPA